MPRRSLNPVKWLFPAISYDRVPWSNYGLCRKSNFSFEFCTPHFHWLFLVFASWDKGRCLIIGFGMGSDLQSQQSHLPPCYACMAWDAIVWLGIRPQSYPLADAGGTWGHVASLRAGSSKARSTSHLISTPSLQSTRGPLACYLPVLGGVPDHDQKLKSGSSKWNSWRHSKNTIIGCLVLGLLHQTVAAPIFWSKKVVFFSPELR